MPAAAPDETRGRTLDRAFDDEIRVLLVEDHDMVAEALALALERLSGITVVARARSIAEGLAEAARCRPSVVLLDRRLPDGDSTHRIAALEAAAGGAARVLVLTGQAGELAAVRAAEAGAAGMILKSAGLGELEYAVRQVAAGGTVFSPGLLTGVLARYTGARDAAAERHGAAPRMLTRREWDTLQLLGEGLPVAEIAGRLGLAVNTVRNHVQRVLEKLGARSQLEAVAVARRRGLLD